MSQKFKAIVIDNQNEKFTREIKEIDTSHLKDGNILVKIDYSSLNYKDALILNNGGKIVRKFPFVPGIDFSGTVVESEGQEAIVELARVLQDEKDLEIIVEGHTDTDAMRSSSHPANNWELSVLRATSVISIMLDNSEMDPVQIMAAGRSEFHPVDPNDKAKNRRIEVIISPDLDELYKLVSE